MTALIKDLKEKGMLEDTLVVWTGEFGRTPDNNRRGGVYALGRGHNADAMDYADGRRRCEEGGRSWVRPMKSARKPPKSYIQSAIYMSRCCTCLGLMTTSLLISTPAATSNLVNSEAR